MVFECKYLVCLARVDPSAFLVCGSLFIRSLKPEWAIVETVECVQISMGQGNQRDRGGAFVSDGEMYAWCRHSALIILKN